MYVVALLLEKYITAIGTESWSIKWKLLAVYHITTTLTFTDQPIRLESDDLMGKMEVFDSYDAYPYLG